MPLYNPFAPPTEYRWMDTPPPLPATLHFETELPDSYSLERGGLHVESEAAVSVNRGEVVTTSTGDYIQTTQRVVTLEASYDVQVTQVDVGAGSQALQTVVEAGATPEAYQQQEAPAVETQAYVDPYASYETGSVAVTGQTSAEVQQQGDFYTDTAIDPSVFQQFGFDQGTTAPDASVYQYFGFSGGEPEPVAVTPPPDPAFLHPEEFL